jgi:putative acetyltransferase
VLIRAENPADLGSIDMVLSRAFARPERDSPPDEVGLVHSLRGTDAWVPQQSLVAIDDDEVVGHSLCTRAMVGDLPCLALGPIGVVPDRQGEGIGTALVNSSVDIAVEMGESLIGLVGDHAFYGRFGFVPGSSVGIDPPDPSWGTYFQVRLLPAYRGVEGVFEYPGPFRVIA